MLVFFTMGGGVTSLHAKFLQPQGLTGFWPDGAVLSVLLAAAKI